MKVYKTTKELLDELEAKGVKINHKIKASKLIKTYSYYSIVNSYKSIFKDSSGNYKDNVAFEEIYALYEFDKNLRAIFLKYILEIETLIRSLVAELISSKYGLQNYLVLSNYDQNINKKTIAENLNKIKDEINRQNGKHEAVTHYLKVYNFLPPFVLVKILTLGQLSRFYAMLKQADRQDISKEFNISDRLLKQIMQNITMVRNRSAHNDILYSFHSKFLISFKYININYIVKDKSTNIYMIMKSMELLLDKIIAKQFEKSILKEIKKLSKKLKSIKIDDVLHLMGFPE